MSLTPRRLASTALSSFALVILAAPPVQSSPLKDPKRVINGQVVELAPLFRWWSKQEGHRPLSAWAHVQGSIAGTNGWSWVIEARVEGGLAKDKSQGKNNRALERAKILLKNPPIQDLNDFEKLSGQLKDLQQQRATLADEEAAAKNQENTNRHSGYRSRLVALENRQLQQTQNQLRDELKPIYKQIQNLKKQLALYPNSDHYEVDCFALDRGLESDGVRIYDYGSAFH